MSTYKHTQTTRLTLVVVGACAAVTALAGVAVDDWMFRLIVFIGITPALIVAWLFSALTVEVTPQELKWHFNAGFWKKSISRADISNVAVVRTRWWYGWGIRLTPKGWLYNVYGLDAVEITWNKGKKVLIGTDEPDRLADALKR